MAKNTHTLKTTNLKTDAEIVGFIKDCYSLKPSDLIMSELIWKFAVRNILREENILLTGPAGSAKTMTAHKLASALSDRPFFSIPLGSTQDPRSALIGNTHFSKDKGTFFSESIFVKAIQTENAIILLDELSRAHPEAWNILMPVLDSTQRFLRLEEKEDSATIPVAKGVSFISTANIGAEYSATRVLDRALQDRFTLVEIATLTMEEEKGLLQQKFPKLDEKLVSAVADIASITRNEVKNAGKISTAISTRTSVRIASLLNDGFTLEESAEVAIYPFFSAEGGANSERTFIKQLVQKYCGEHEKTEEETGADDALFTDEDIKNLTT